MIYYIIFVIILATILLVLFTELIHDSKEKFKKKIKLILLIFLSTIVLLIMTRFPQVISVVPAIFLILFRWRFLINFLANLVFLKKTRFFHKTIRQKWSFRDIRSKKRCIQGWNCKKISRINEKESSR